MNDKDLLEAAKVISENCANRETCKGCPFKHTGENCLDNFCILKEPVVSYWWALIEKMQKVVIE